MIKIEEEHRIPLIYSRLLLERSDGEETHYARRARQAVEWIVGDMSEQERRFLRLVVFSAIFAPGNWIDLRLFMRPRSTLKYEWHIAIGFVC